MGFPFSSDWGLCLNKESRQESIRLDLRVGRLSIFGSGCK